MIIIINILMCMAMRELKIVQGAVTSVKVIQINIFEPYHEGGREGVGLGR